MSTVSIVFNHNMEEDGIDGSVTLVRHGVEDLHALSRFCADAARAAGYNYVQDVGFEKDDGNMVFGGF